jgi:hypothetical protein
MVVVVAIGGFRIFTHQRAFNFKSLLITLELLSIFPITLGISYAIGPAVVSLKSASASSASEANMNPRLQEAATKSKKSELKDESLRCVMYLSYWAPN